MKFSTIAAGLLSSGCAVLAAPVASPVAEPVPMPMPSPPGIPSASAAKTQLAGLKVRTGADPAGYKRTLFPTWITISGTCNTRDGESPYDGGSWTQASDLDIDHMVPLKNAWISGADQWTTDKRREFANDVDRPQLWAVTDSVNSSKSDKSPDAWKPPLASFYCVYARSWVQVKAHWELTVTSAEKAALTSMLNTC
ncbi:uncharacterized protein PG998_006586 [Apiospora kogelbergensis]|uniref:uncharacterized protein n=1 Tax=Apiospora kogelbergensis TaxID=1337665 RepID=UPI0031305725